MELYAGMDLHSRNTFVGIMGFENFLFVLILLKESPVDGRQTQTHRRIPFTCRKASGWGRNLITGKALDASRRSRTLGGAKATPFEPCEIPFWREDDTLVVD